MPAKKLKKPQNKKALELKPSKPKQEKAPAFMDVNDKNIRNNFGYSLEKRKNIEKELEEINQRLKKHSPSNSNTTKDNNNNSNNIYNKFNSNKNYAFSSNKTNLTSIIIYSIIGIAALAIFLSLFLLIRTQTAYVDDGTCFVRIETIDQGRTERLYTELPGTECNTHQDCRQTLISQGFSEQDVDRMRIRCREE